MVWMDFPGDRVTVCGLPWFGETAPRMHRWPERAAGVVPEGVYAGGACTAGVRLRFRSDTGTLALRGVWPPFDVRTNMTQFTTHGIATYVDGVCWSARIPPAEGGAQDLVLFDGAEREPREICLYLPLYGGIDVQAVGMDDGATVDAPAPFALPKPVVFYGTSITQGGCASRPGLSYQGVLCRELNLDYVNYGFSGLGKCEAEVAELLTEIDAAAFVMDAGQNGTVDELRSRYARFVQIVRDAAPEVPMLVTEPIFYNAELWSRSHRESLEAKRAIVRDTVETRRRNGDTRIRLLALQDYHGGDVTDGAVDGGHPNDLGFARMARGMRGPLAAVLNLLHDVAA